VRIAWRPASGRLSTPRQIPSRYRKRDLSALDDEPMHGYVAARGHGAMRLEIRSSGESDGIIRDEYLAQELNDAGDAIGLLATQS